ncbi:radical SAM protein [Pandoraea communis]|uniref:Radical SAM protein n=1 Tax=Pandoraea communis TaxID=2508297 RepID=A0A5E4TZI0_9BURK|nr:radical SAM protein [Pandoraea communis]MDM8355155.1 radical SAM protein [Pandoraea communis]VVD92034.1 radical SAM protein [Pandoraea communis]
MTTRSGKGSDVASGSAGDLLVMVKVAERCNIDCDYCYMYQGVDQGWRQRPKFLSEPHLDQLVERLTEHRHAFPSARMTLEIHGGEPLLLGKRRTARFFEHLRHRLSEAELAIVTQSNGVLIDTSWLDLYAEFGATLGISCDGPPALHDRHRYDFEKQGTGARVEQAIRLCLSYPQSRRVFNGVLAVIDPNNDPVRILDYFRALGLSDVDFLLPDANFSAPPRHIQAYTHARLLAFLCRGFDAWLAIDDPAFHVRIFETFIRGVLGRRSELDAFGGALAPITVVESDGSYRLLDVLSICKTDASYTGLGLEKHKLQDFVDLARARYPEVHAACRECEAFVACGGGYVAHRFDGESYDNPSFYCSALVGFYRHVRAHVNRLSIATPVN